MFTSVQECDLANEHPENQLEMARRHEREGEARLPRHVVLVEEMERHHHHEPATLARKCQRICEQRSIWRIPSALY